MKRLLDPNTFSDYAGQPGTITRPATSAIGLTVTPGNNAYGAYAAGGVVSTQTGYGLWIIVQNVAVSASAKDLLFTIGKDDAGGTSFSDWITDVAGSCAQPLSAGGVAYYLPILVPAGAALSAKATVNNATVGTARVILMAALRPSNAPGAWYGTHVRTYGSTPATSTGTAVTSGTGAEGAWTALGTVAAGDRIRYLEFGFTINNATMNALVYAVDIGVGSGGTAKLASCNTFVATTASETVLKPASSGGWCDAFAGDTIYGRIQCSGTPDTGIGLIAYGVG